MKTIQNTRGDIKRVDDETAFNYVRLGEWKYISKQLWKRTVRSKYEEDNPVKDILGKNKKKKQLSRKEKRILKNERINK